MNNTDTSNHIFSITISKATNETTVANIRKGLEKLINETIDLDSEAIIIVEENSIYKSSKQFGTKNQKIVLKG